MKRKWRDELREAFTSTPGVIAIAVILVAFISGLLFAASIANAVVLAVVVAIIALPIVFVLRSVRDPDRVLPAAYTEPRGLTGLGAVPLDPVTSFFREPDRCLPEAVFEGRFGPGTVGRLATVVLVRGGRGKDLTLDRTLTLVELPGVSGNLHLRHSRIRALDRVDERFRGIASRRKVEGLSLPSHHTATVIDDAGENLARELMTPEFTAWLEQEAPPRLDFQFEDGWLCVLIPGRRNDPDRIDGLMAATHELGGRLRQAAG